MLLSANNALGAEFLAQVQRRARKYNTGSIIITQQPNIVPLSEISLSWLRENSRFLDDMRNQLMSTLKIKTDYLSEDLKIIIESWIVQECK